MTDNEYHNRPEISQSAIKDFRKNRKSYEYCYVKGLGTGKSTKAMDKGTLNHCLIFEPDEFHNRYAHFSGEVPNSPQAWKFYDLCFGEQAMSEADAYVNSYSCKSKTPAVIRSEAEASYYKYEPYANWMKENAHKILITPEVELEARQMVDIFYRHPGVMKTLVAGRVNPKYKIFKEQVIFWTIFDAACRQKCDEIHVDIEKQMIYAYDYKTTNSENVKSFISSIKFYGYDTQDSFYTTGLKQWASAMFGMEFRVEFRFLPQYSKAPYNVIDVVVISDEDREAAYLEWTKDLQELKECLETGNFDNPAAYSEDGINRVKLNNNVNVMVLDDGF